MREHKYSFDGSNPTVFCSEKGKVWLSNLLGMPCGFCGRDEGPVRARGLISLATDSGRFEAETMIVEKKSFYGNKANIVWTTSDKNIKIDSLWEFCKETGVLSRKDKLSNNGNRTITVFRCQSRIVFSPSSYEIYFQSSRWSNENQGFWAEVKSGSIVLKNEEGRTCQGGTPYMCLRDKNTGQGIAFHIVTRGNWEIKTTSHTSGGDCVPFAAVELGLAGENLKLEVNPGESMELPEILMQHLPEGKPHLGIDKLHKYLLKNRFMNFKKKCPVVYNTWFDFFEDLRVDRLRRQLSVAKEIGCEIFVIDAGWYGQCKGNWYEQVGDWREKQDRAFHGKMREFADEVKKAGLGFGLWMEPERVSMQTPVYKQHPDWFVKAENSNYCRPDLEKEEVFEYMYSEVSRLIETYGLSWMKIDSNYEFGFDKKEFYGYYRKWNDLRDKLRAKYPGMFFEGCESGGMHLDLNALSFCDGHFLSDTVNPIDVLRIYQGAVLRALPGRIIKWAVLRGVGKTIPAYGIPIESTPDSIAVPGGATWSISGAASVDFVCRIALCGMFGTSGDLSGLSAGARKRLKWHVDFFKKWRGTIAGSVGYLLTEPKIKEDSKGWAGIQLSNPENKRTLLFIYRLDDRLDTRRFYLKGLEPKHRYSVLNADAGKKIYISGRELMDVGFDVSLPTAYSAGLYVISAK